MNDQYTTEDAMSRVQSERARLRETARNGETEAERREARLRLVDIDMERHADVYDALADE